MTGPACSTPGARTRIGAEDSPGRDPCAHPARESHVTSYEGQISNLTSALDALAAKIRTALEYAAFSNKALNEQQAKGYIRQAQSLLNQAAALASTS